MILLAKSLPIYYNVFRKSYLKGTYGK